MASMKVAISGGGLVGALCGCILGQRGHQVELYEYRADPRSAEGKLVRGKSINLALSTRGRTTLARAGLEDVILAHAIPMKGRMLHSVDGGRKEVLYDPNGHQEYCMTCCSLYDTMPALRFSYRLTNACITFSGDIDPEAKRCIKSLNISADSKKAEKNPNVKLHFNHKLISADFNKGTLQLRKKEGSQENHIEIEADLVIGADGAHSAMRQSMLKRSRTNFSQTYIEHGYMELSIPPTSKGEHAMEKNYLHIWPRNQFMLIALPNQDGSFTVTLFMPFEMFSQLTTAEAIRSFFHTEFPDTLDLIGEELLISDVLTSKPSSLISVKCSPLHSGKGVLIGDAAHAMVPFYGQGMNAGFEDVLILDDLLDNWTVEGMEKCLEAFTRERSKDAEAICELAMYNYLEMRSLVNQRGFYFRRLIDLSLYKLLGHGWMPLYNAVTFSRIPYSKCISHRKHQDEILKRINRYFAFAAIGCLTASAFYWRKSFPIPSSWDIQCLSKIHT